MIAPSVVLCADEESLQYPESLGLSGENLMAQRWLQIFSSAQEARLFIQANFSVEEVWVVSNSQISPINLAATIKRDRPEVKVCVVTGQETGSLRSRVSASGIDASLTYQSFVESYTQRKRQSFVRLSKAEDSSRVVLERGDAGKSSAFFLPVVSGSGGAGKSSIAVLSAFLLQGLGYDTLLVDFDLQFGDASELLGVKNPLRIEEVIASPRKLVQLQPEGRIPALLAAPRRLEESESIARKAPWLLDQLMNRFDAVVCNTGAAWAEQHAVLLERSSKALFLVDQRPSSVRACRHAVDLCARCGIATTPFVFALNRCSKKASLTSIDVSCALHGAPVVELKDGGRDVDELLGAGLPSELLASKNDLCISLEQVLLNLLPSEHKFLSAVKHEERQSSLFKNGKFRKRKRGVLCH